MSAIDILDQFRTPDSVKRLDQLCVIYGPAMSRALRAVLEMTDPIAELAKRIIEKELGDE